MVTSQPPAPLNPISQPWGDRQKPTLQRLWGGLHSLSPATAHEESRDANAWQILLGRRPMVLESREESTEQPLPVSPHHYLS